MAPAPHGSFIYQSVLGLAVSKSGVFPQKRKTTFKNRRCRGDARVCQARTRGNTRKKQREAGTGKLGQSAVHPRSWPIAANATHGADRHPSICSTPLTMSDGPEGGEEADSHTADTGDPVDTGEAVAEEEPEGAEEEGEGVNTNYDSGDGAVPAFRCDRCDNYEALSKAALGAHRAHCVATTQENPEEDADADNDDHRAHRKMFECDVCNMKFSNGANMRRHKMRHTGVKPYECRVCQKRFFRKDHLAEHFTTHSKTLPYHCPICNRGFQRQIAMRAHFQNEHVGQHDMVKSCPLCSYRAATMKCLRLHFFNRHGIDLDNPGPNPSSSLLPSLTAEAVPSGLSGLSDSGDSGGARSADNATPPMHFLTPHVEISIPYADQPHGASPTANGDSPGSPQSADSNSNAPSSSHHQMNSVNSSGIHRPLPTSEEAITPSISLIPIKQEPANGSLGAEEGGGATSSLPLPLPSLIKVSPLKSLLREDLRRKLGAGGNGGNGNGSHNTPHSREPTSTRPEQRQQTNSLQCSHCRITFPDQTLYFLHKGCHSESNPWKCNICGEQCCNLYQFNSHLLSKSHQ